LTGGLKGFGHGDEAIVKTTQPTARTLLWRDEAATQSFAEALAARPAIHNAFIELHGDLGAGKTTLVRHLLRALGVQGRIKSPTYAVVEPYELRGLNGAAGSFNIWHFDFYRFSDPREWADAGFRDTFASPGLKLAEWPENVAGQLPLADLALHIAVLPDESREVTVVPQTALGEDLLKGVLP
jgi:tRNA threonylcarbamoyladenosine biosynthesis protein TsaE